ncbi:MULTISPECIES: PucR family transcriptional regulator [Hyphomonas]|nr:MULTISPECIES: helix-turn-helix domain-containing protein [Hyphomonas]KCZ62264.1 hypothetical protein HY36_15965 [Hyphomonas atlantica]|tara:strand:- start:845 stop:2041 length:1197 start_codon:yes stop_codon:yes gene_type:complete
MMNSFDGRVDELLRQGAERVLKAPQSWRDEVGKAVVTAIESDNLPFVESVIRRENLIGVMHWANSILSDPNGPITPVISSELYAIIREQVRKGELDISLNGYRVAQNITWRRWMRIVFDLTSDKHELQAVLDRSARSIGDYTDAALAILSRFIDAERAELAKGAPALQREVLQQVLSGKLGDPFSAGQRLGYRFDRSHTVVRIWAMDVQPDSALVNRATDQIVQVLGHAPGLRVEEGESSIFLCFDKQIQAAELESECPDGVMVAIGRLGQGFAGFLESANSARIVRNILAGARNGRRVADHDLVRLQTVLIPDDGAFQRFASDVLGDLLRAPEDLKRNLLTYLKQGCNAAYTADQLGIHRNTLNRQLDRVNDLLPQALGDGNRMNIAVALEGLLWRP